MANNLITQRIRVFKKDLRESPLDRVVTKHMTTGKCFLLDDEMYADLRYDIATFLDIHPNDVILVGSAKLGFSVVPKKRTIDYDTGRTSPMKRYQHYDENESDIDIAVCNAILFDRFWKDAISYQGDWREKDGFMRYLGNGWIRPDKLPGKTKKEWFDFFEELKKSNKYGTNKIACGVYKDWFFLEKYQITALKSCLHEDNIKRNK